MTRSLYAFICFLLLSLAANSQVEQAREVTKRVADYIVKNTTYRFVDTNTGKLYNNLKDAPVTAAVKTESEYNKWEYSNGVMAWGMMQLSETLSDTAYLNYIGRNFDFVYENINVAKQRYTTNPRTEFYNLLRMDRLDDCGALGAALAQYNQIRPQQPYQYYINKAVNFVSAKQDRLTDGTFSRKQPRQMTIWADDLYMSVPFLAAMGKINKNDKYTADAIQQVEQFSQYLYDKQTGLYFHTWYSDVQSNGVAHWLRCNGWLAMAQVELLSALPPTHPKRKLLTEMLLTQIIGFSRYQDTTGLWHQVIDKPDSYLETSGTAMFVYTVAKAVNEGWIPKTYLSIAEDGWKGLVKKVTDDGQVQDVCIGTGIRDNISFYYNRPRKLNDFHVAGAFLLAGSEMIKSYRIKK